jgi:hypothetical protein
MTGEFDPPIRTNGAWGLPLEIVSVRDAQEVFNDRFSPAITGRFEWRLMATAINAYCRPGPYADADTVRRCIELALLNEGMLAPTNQEPDTLQIL